MKCTLCDKSITDDIEYAIDEGWIPNFWCNDQEYGPVCTHCTEKFLEANIDGWNIKEVFKQTFLDSASSKRFNMVLADVPTAASLYPDLDLIKMLRGKFLEHTVDSLTKEELIDLINHQHQRILDLDRKVEELDKEIETMNDDF